MIMGVVSAAGLAQAASYNAVINLKFYNTPKCIAMNIDEVYWRISDTYKDPQTGQHNHLVVKGEVNNPAGIIANKLSHHEAPTITITAPFYPDHFKTKYGYSLAELREYIEGLKSGVEKFDDYKPIRAFSLSQHQYTWTHGIKFTNCA